LVLTTSSAKTKFSKPCRTRRGIASIRAPASDTESLTWALVGGQPVSTASLSGADENHRRAAWIKRSAKIGSGQK